MTDGLDILADAVVASENTRWEVRPCRACGADVRLPMSIIAGTALEAVASEALCDSCETIEADRLMKRIVDEMHDPAELIERSGIANHPEVELADVVRAWWESDVAGLLLVGEVGTGKTWQANQLIREWCRDTRRPATYVTEIELFERLKEWHQRAEVKQALRTVPLLVIDDVGADIATDHRAVDFFDLVDFREQRCRKDDKVVLRTVFISNYGPDELKSRQTKEQSLMWDPRTFIRVNRLCGGAAKRLRRTW